MDKEPDYIFDDLAINERWWDWLEEIGGINPGDEIIVETTTREWETPMKVIDENWRDEITFITQSGKKYMIVDYSSNHPLEDPSPMVRTCEGFDSMGEIKTVKVYK